jgi:hypothetical protein
LVQTLSKHGDILRENQGGFGSNGKLFELLELLASLLKCGGDLWLAKTFNLLHG